MWQNLKNICRSVEVQLQFSKRYLKTSLVEIASAVERMVLSVDPDFEKDQTNDAENLTNHDTTIFP